MLEVPLEPGARADLSAWRAPGMRAAVTGNIDVSGLRVAPADILGGPVDYFRHPDFSGGSPRCSLAASRRCLTPGGGIPPLPAAAATRTYVSEASRMSSGPARDPSTARPRPDG
jgi:hypothetical protein